MPFSGGTFSRTYVWATEALTPPIAIDKLDTQEEDIAAALSNCILRDGTGLPTAAIDWNAQRITNLGAATAANDAVRAAQIQGGALLTLGSVAGTNTITGSLTPALAAYVAHMQVKFTPANNNTGATTLNVNSLGALDVLKADGDALASGDLVAGVPAVLVLDSVADDWILLNPQSANLSNGVAMSDLARLSQANTFTLNQTIAGATAEKLRFVAPDATGDDYFTFYRSDGTTRKGYVGFGAAGDDTFSIALEESGANLDLGTTGGGAVRVNGQDVRNAALFTAGTLPVARGGTGTTTATGTGNLVLATSPTISAPTLSGAITFSDPVLAPSGSAAAPSLSFSTDPDTGVYRASANVVGIAAGGSQVMAIGGGGVDINPTTLGLDADGTRRLIVTGAGSPEGAVTAGVGSIYLRNDGGAGTSFYVKETGSGNTGWAAK